MNLRKNFFGQYLLVCMFVLFITFTLIVGIIVQLQNIRYYKEEISTLENQIEAVDIEIEKFQNKKFYKNDKELENLARNELGMVKKHEIIYIEK